eukprot:TRINITY_DN5551_c0_g1_i1.p1 TRINITY_DN5551_c0_g1~~TRINITY_DN5551_c0_g1_i1.p1  ORF type:complete len:161 (+),score=20.56 TRINITY_DN5551_c0_g1_i1:434-916(+)
MSSKCSLKCSQFFELIRQASSNFSVAARDELNTTLLAQKHKEPDSPEEPFVGCMTTLRANFTQIIQLLENAETPAKKYITGVVVDQGEPLPWLHHPGTIRSELQQAASVRWRTTQKTLTEVTRRKEELYAIRQKQSNAVSQIGLTEKQNEYLQECKTTRC